MLVPMREVML